jgi:hypothetical protein
MKLLLLKFLHVRSALLCMNCIIGISGDTRLDAEWIIEELEYLSQHGYNGAGVAMARSRLFQECGQ